MQDLLQSLDPRGLPTFGALWLHVLLPLAAMALAGWAIQRRSPLEVGVGLRFADGAARLLRLPAWVAAPLVLALGYALPFAVMGFFWDVAWHIDIGRDELLFSPPHVHLLLGLTGIGLSGLLATRVVGAALGRRRGGRVAFAHTPPPTRVGWAIGRHRVPFAALAQMVAGAAALVGYGIDELWHAAYGLDVTMWSPPHLTMISSAAFSGFTVWLLLAEAGPVDATTSAVARRWRRGLATFAAAVILIALSAWQLEFDLGVPQWQQLYQPVLIAIAGGAALVAAREGLGRGGALLATGGYLAVRLLLAVVTGWVWGLSWPWMPLHLGGALAVEAVFAWLPTAAPQRRAVVAGAAVGTVGIAVEWLWTQVGAWHPWGPGLLPEIGIAVLGAVGGAMLGAAAGRVYAFRPTGFRPRHAAVAGLLLVVALAVPFPRHAPEAEVTIRTTPAGDGLVDVTVEVDPPEVVAGASRFEAMAWQGDGHVNATLEPVGDGVWRAERPVPVGGTWKTLIRLNNGAAIGGAPIALPADVAIGAAAVPLEPVRTQAMVSEQELLLREAHDGPGWPGVVAWLWVAASPAAIVGAVVCGLVALDRRRRARGWTAPGDPGALQGQRVLLTGSAGGIGRAARRALEGAGARVVGLDLHPDRPGDVAVDLADPDGAAAAVAAARERLGGLDVVVANAGLGTAADSTAPPGAAGRRVVDVNLLASWEVVAAALPRLADDGRVIAVTSGLARATVPWAAAYTASKRGLAGYLAVLRMELAATGRDITVTELAPAYIDTMIHAGPEAVGASLDGLVRREDVEDAAAAVVTACEGRRRWLGSSPLTTLELWAAHHLPRTVEHVLRRRLRRIEATRGRPTFAADGAAPDDPAPHERGATATLTLDDDRAPSAATRGPA